MNDMSSNTECINGWIELLHFKSDPDKIHLAKPLLKSTDSLENFKEAHYEMVGSHIPLCEYYSAIEVYKQFVVPIDKEFNIPRPLGDYDAMNLCMRDPKFGRKFLTFIFYPKGLQHAVKFREQRVQYHPDYPHVLLIRKEPFRSFLRPPEESL